MSTIKSSSANLTLNADGSGNDILFQSNAVEKGSLTDGGVFTATSLVDGAGGVVSRPRATPLIINGDMKVYQRGSVNLTDNAALYTLDRWRGFMRGGPLCTATQDSDVPTTGGFANSWKIDVTTGDALTGASNDLALLSYTFEGQDLQHWKKGTADAETITVAFWIKSTVTGTYILELYDGDNTRTCNIAYTVSSADTWEHKVVNFPADTTGAFNDDNTLACYLQWYLGAGTNYTGGTLSTTWASIDGGSTNRAEGQVNAVNSASNNIYITGVQVEVGTYTSATLPPFQHENYGDSLARCQRYYQILVDGGADKAIGVGFYWSSNEVDYTHRFVTDMRASPTLEQVVGTDYYRVSANGDSFNGFSGIQYGSTRSCNMYISAYVSGTAGFASDIRSRNAASFIAFTAEL